ncbi:hypothetical protein [Leclercia adecarboxylata]|uniref:hypothetical protein n=1 Tax=Leclercia adecarboxylata TaxID=83655 RepID=UPI001785F9E5
MAALLAAVWSARLLAFAEESRAEDHDGDPFSAIQIGMCHTFGLCAGKERSTRGPHET